MSNETMSILLGILAIFSLVTFAALASLWERHNKFVKTVENILIDHGLAERKKTWVPVRASKYGIPSWCLVSKRKR